MEIVLGAAGLAEAALALGMIIISGGLIIIGFVALSAWLIQSRIMAAIGVVLLLALSLYFEIWNCFVPLPKEEYFDPDFASAADNFLLLGLFWVLTSLFAITSMIAVWFRIKLPVTGMKVAWTRIVAKAAMPEPTSEDGS